jgi:AraC-like DNA-binding protein
MIRSLLLILLILELIFCIHAYGGAPAEFIEPKPHSIINQDFVKLNISVNPDSFAREGGIKEVRFYSTGDVFHEFPSTVSRGYAPLVLIGKAQKPPWEIIWNLKNITDRYFGYGMLFCEIQGSAGNILTVKPSSKVLFSLDRNQTIKGLKTYSIYFEENERPLSGLPDSLFTYIRKGNNLVKFASAWNSESLLFYIQVEDEYLTAEFDTAARLGREAFKNSDTGYRYLWLGDCIELCFDPLNKRSVIRTKAQMEYLISVLGISEGNNADFYEEKIYLWGKDIRTRLTLQGTVNDHSDIDSGYSVSVSIPWQELGITAADTMSFGFDLFNMDFDLSRENNDNPSEWGTLVIVKKKGGHGVLIFILTAGILLGLILVLFKRPRQTIKSPEPGQKPVYSEAIEKVINHLNDNYKREISLEEMAKIGGLSPSWLSTTFKKETGRAPSEYLTEIRIKKACDILQNTKKSATQVGFEVGFKDQSYFTKVFKKITGTTPLDYRKKS